jgi:hypothetical protein
MFTCNWVNYHKMLKNFEMYISVSVGWAFFPLHLYCVGCEFKENGVITRKYIDTVYLINVCYCVFGGIGAILFPKKICITSRQYMC